MTAVEDDRLVRLGPDDLTRFRIPDQVALSPVGNLAAMLVRRADPALDRWTRSLVVVDTTSSVAGEPELAGGGVDAPCWSATGRLAFIHKGQKQTHVRVWDPATGDNRELLRWPGPIAELAWSPDGDRLAFTASTRRSDGQQDSARQPLVVSDVRYKVDGVGLMPPVPRGLHLVDVASGVVRTLVGDVDVHAPSWSLDGRSIAFGGATPRPGDAAPVASVFLVDVDSGEHTRIGDWQGTVAWTGRLSDGRVVFAGRRAPGPCQHGSLYRLDDGSLTPVDLLEVFDRRIMASNRGNPPAAVLVPDGRFLFCAREAGCTWVYAVPEGGGRVTPWLTGASTVVQSMSLAADTGEVALIVSDAHNAGELYIADAQGERRRVTNLNGWSRRARTTVPEAIRFSAPDRVGIHGYLLRGRPVGTDGPTLIDIHGGPDNAWRPNFSPYYLYRQMLADRGWNVLLLNPRGSDGYGWEFMRSPLGRLGFSEEEDFLLALDHMILDGLASEGRVAVMGASHGGFMTNWLLARTGRFATGISIACVSNWTSLYGTSSVGATTAPILLGDTPCRVPDRYVASSPLSYVEGVTAPMLLIHGDDDLMNPVGQSEEWFTALRVLGRPVEFVRYPSAGHLFMYGGRISHQRDYARRLVSWLVDHVGTAEGDAGRVEPARPDRETV